MSNQLIAVIHMNLMQIGNDFNSDVSIDKVLGEFEMLSKNIELLVTSDETDKRDCSVGDVVNGWQCESWRWEDGSKARLVGSL